MNRRINEPHFGEIRMKTFFIICYATFSTLGCGYALESMHPTASSVGTGATQSLPVAGTLIDYAQIKTQIIAPNCYACHTAASGNQGGINLETYQNVLNHLVDIQADIADGSMPKNSNPLSANEKSLLNTWVSQGSPQTVSSVTIPVSTPTPISTPNSGAPSTNTAPAAITYQTVNAQIFQPSCLSCHSTNGGNSAGINLETYANVLKHISSVKVVISNGTMPIGGHLSSAKKKLISDWIAAGAPQTAPPAKNIVNNSATRSMTKAYVDFMIQQNSKPSTVNEHFLQQ